MASQTPEYRYRQLAGARTSVRVVMLTDQPRLDVRATPLHAARAMRVHQAHAVLVLSYGDLVGIVTARDLVIRGLATGRSPVEGTLADVMTPYPVWISADEEIPTAIRLMCDHRVHRLPVYDLDQVAGIVTIANVAPWADPATIAMLLKAHPDA